MKLKGFTIYVDLFEQPFEIDGIPNKHRIAVFKNVWNNHYYFSIIAVDKEKHSVFPFFLRLNEYLDWMWIAKPPISSPRLQNK